MAQAIVQSQALVGQVGFSFKMSKFSFELWTMNLRPLKAFYKKICELAMAFHAYLAHKDICGRKA